MDEEDLGEVGQVVNEQKQQDTLVEIEKQTTEELLELVQSGDQFYLGGSITLKYQPSNMANLNLYCICKEKKLTSDWIACDSCENWFHSDCISPSTDDDYYCEKCINWAKQKISFVENTNYKNSLEDIIPKDSDYLRVGDFIIAASFCSDMIQYVQENTVTKTMIVKLINILQRIPFNFQNHLCALYQRLYVSIYLNKILENKL